MLAGTLTLALPAPSFAQGSCDPLPPPSGAVIDVTPGQAGNLASIIAAARTGDTIRLADGTYVLSQNLVFRTPGVTLRSRSGNRSAVTLDGQYKVGELIMAMVSDLTIADLTLTRAYYHPVHVAPENQSITGTLLHNLRIVDGASQFIKINPANGYYTDNGVIRCSSLELTDAGRGQVRDNCYTGGIDAHQSRGWQVYANTFTGFWCGSGLSEHAIHFWTGSRDTVVDRNIIVNSARGIGFGLGQSVSGRTYGDQPCAGKSFVGHYGGTIRNNFIFANDTRLFNSASGFDVGIGLEQACGAAVLHNTIFSTSAPRGSSLEWRFVNTSATVGNNLVSHTLRARDGGIATLVGNVANAAAAMFVDAIQTGDLHLRATATSAIDQAVPLGTPVLWDIDGSPRNPPADVGADEYSSAAMLHPPTNLAATSIVGNAVTLGWIAPSGGIAPSGYVLEGGVTPGSVLASLPIGSAATTFSFVAPTGVFYVRMRSVAGATKSAASNEIQILVNVSAPPAAPSGLLGLANGPSLTLAWRTSMPGGAPTGMILSVTGAVATSMVLPVSDSFSFVGVPPGTYSFAIRAFNGTGRSGPSNTVTLTFPGTCATPYTPANFTATKSGNRVSISWAPALSGPAPTGYLVIVRGSFVADIPTTFRTLAANAPAGSYLLSVVATNPCGTSSPTATQTITIS